MDGVLVGFFETADRILHDHNLPSFIDPYWKNYSQETADDMRFDCIRSHKDFWLELPFTDDGKRLWEFVKSYKPHILSASQKRMPLSVPHKLIWLDANIGLANLAQAHIVHRADKKLFAVDKYTKAPNVLVDDYDVNCAEWVAAGGIAVHHVNIDDTIDELKRLGY